MHFYIYYYKIKEGNIQKQMFNRNNSSNVILHNSIGSLNVYTNVHCYVPRLMAIANLYYLSLGTHDESVKTRDNPFKRSSLVPAVKIISEIPARNTLPYASPTSNYITRICNCTFIIILPFHILL